jgi:thiamine transporter
MESSRVRLLAEVPIFVALALVLNHIKIYQLPYGGSVTLGSMVPILLLAYRWGLRVGVFGGAVFGLIQMILDGWVYHPLGMFLDYPLAFGFLGLAALLEDRPLIGVVVALTSRFLSHFLSGVLFFWMYAPEGMSPILYSALYNGSYILPEMAISAILIYLLHRRGILTLR